MSATEQAAELISTIRKRDAAHFSKLLAASVPLEEVVNGTLALLERVSLDDIARQAQPNPLHPQHGAHHHG